MSNTDDDQDDDNNNNKKKKMKKKNKKKKILKFRNSFSLAMIGVPGTISSVTAAPPIT